MSTQGQAPWLGLEPMGVGLAKAKRAGTPGGPLKLVFDVSQTSHLFYVPERPPDLFPRLTCIMREMGGNGTESSIFLTEP